MRKISIVTQALRRPALSGPLTAVLIALISYKRISSCFSSAYVEMLSTCEVLEALKRLETLTPLSCFPNFPRAQYLDIRTLTHELIVIVN